MFCVLLALTRVCCRSVWVWGSGPPAGTWGVGFPDCCPGSDPPPPRSDWLSCSCWRPSWCLSRANMSVIQRQVWVEEATVSEMSIVSPWLLVANMKVSGYFWHILWTTSICSSVCLTASLYWLSQGTYADQNCKRNRDHVLIINTPCIQGIVIALILSS